jgi:flagellar biosynthetic protein FlhB
MAAYADEKTEPPTPRRRQEARRRGQVPRSQDLSAAVLLLAGFLALAFLGPGIWHTLLAITRAGLTGETTARTDDVLRFAGTAAFEAIKWIAPFLLILMFATLATLVAQVGLLFTGQPLIPSLAKINPLNGIKRLFSIRSVMLGVVSFGKLLVVGVVAYLTISGSSDAIIYAFTFGAAEVLRLGASQVFSLTMRLSAALLILALLDLAWQRYRHERDLRMTKEEVKDELRSMEGDPQIKRRRREVQLRLALQRLRKDVPTADVVVTNPTHVAVAIRYQADTMPAPKVVAKGADLVALRIRQIAAEFRIPIVQRPPLARALYESVDVGQYIPERLYRVIAEILAYVYELAGRSVVTRSPNRAGVH